MMECEVTTRRWGNSLGVVLPREVVEQEKIKEDELIHVLLLKRHRTVGQSFGMFKGKIKKPTPQIMQEIRSELYHE